VIDWQRERDRMWAMWSDPVHQYRVNIVDRIGGKVPLHRHNYDHTLLVPAGVFRVRVLPPDGSEAVKMIGAPHLGADACHLHIPATHEHELELVKMDPGIPGAAWCIFPNERFG
jgi:hypothetical protein